MAVLIPLAAGGFWLHHWFNPTSYEGRVTTITGQAPTRQVTVRLKNSTIVITRFDDDDRPTAIRLNQCWHLMEHWSTHEFRRVYSLETPFCGRI
jgi:hypothetical protein